MSGLSAIQERVGVICAKADAAHARIDKLELGVRDDLKGMREEFRSLSIELNKVIAWMNQVKGWAAAAVLMSGIIGSVGTALLSHWLGT